MNRDKNIENAIDYLGEVYQIVDLHHKNYKSLVFIQNELKNTKYSAKAIRAAIDEAIALSPKFLPTIASIKECLKITGVHENVSDIDDMQKESMLELYEFCCYYHKHIDKEFYPDPLINYKTNTYNTYLKYMKERDYCSTLNYINQKGVIPTLDVNDVEGYRYQVYKKIWKYCYLKNRTARNNDKAYKPILPDPSVLTMRLDKLKQTDKEYTEKLKRI